MRFELISRHSNTALKNKNSVQTILAILVRKPFIHEPLRVANFDFLTYPKNKLHLGYFSEDGSGTNKNNFETRLGEIEGIKEALVSLDNLTYSVLSNLQKSKV